MNLDLVLRNIRQLNIVAGEGESFVQATAVGAQLATREPIQLRLYSNGILMFEGPFRSYEEPSTQVPSLPTKTVFCTLDVPSSVHQRCSLASQRCLQDLMDGYFPSELQDRYPDGVPFQVSIHRD